MRRKSRLASSLARLALAYLLALQALLGAWLLPAGASHAFDPSLSLCRTLADGDAQNSGDGTGAPRHCVAMCLSGGCGNGDPPAAASASVAFLPPRDIAVAVAAYADIVPASAQPIRPSARGPPQID